MPTLKTLLIEQNYGASVIQQLDDYLRDNGNRYIATSGLISTSAGGIIDGIMRINNGYHTHFQFLIRASADCSIYLFENPVVVSSGIDHPIINTNRRFATPSLHATLYLGASIAGTGLTLINTYLPSGTGKFNSGSGSDSVGGSWVLNGDTDYPYLLRVMPLAAGTFAMAAVMYEQENE